LNTPRQATQTNQALHHNYGSTERAAGADSGSRHARVAISTYRDSLPPHYQSLQSPMESGVEAKGLTRYASGHLSQRLLPGRAWASLHAELIELSTVFLPCPCGPVGPDQIASGQRLWSQHSSSEKTHYLTRWPGPVMGGGSTCWGTSPAGGSALACSLTLSPSGPAIT
jgi:hypothetical protein